ncbi:alpha-hydroxy-acid oxidizing protein [Desulfohalobium retbaense]|uniref:FMN-dependent alpha-hydroxy acid dehydrogenase n=1 Tax=Desulfohalobium retbaense (strain ATCC 49708 / DSM 5692 / JCM 16813 / HR100) TaxID=485915 RepID=C8WZI4_DESRD|nr:alpha-hydroxy-acid oxidizing protein [Desulfohalobium retbaense]ACV67459.1 FMN-dependent alpha-hydroxy acid dehydrogenase [Desulfohalobium retbaense DSM 5692]
MKEIKDTARELMKGYCRVCRVCDGKACAGEVPGMGGLGTGSAFQSNVTALAEKQFNMRLLHEVTEPDTSVEMLGQTLDIPVLAAPIGGVSFNMGGGVSEGEYIRAVVNGCKAEGTLGCVGDGVPPFIHEEGYAAIAEAGGAGIPFIKPWEDEELYEKMRKAADAGASIVGMDVDAAGLITLRKMGRPVSPKPAHELRKIRETTSMRFIIKGVMTPDEAKLAVEAGADGIVVSNHGGRVLDHTPGVAEILAGVADAVQGQTAILADGGVRTGGDVLKMLALGAEAVMVGRPISIAAVGGLEDGVRAALQQMRTELKQAMVLTGTARASAVQPQILHS